MHLQCKPVTAAQLLLLLVTLSSVAITGTRALKCFVCNSLVDKDCDSVTVPTAYNVNCSVGRTVGPDSVSLQEAKVCWKQYQDVDGFTIVDRTCGPALDGDRHCYYRVGTNKIKVTYCVCDGDGCNAAGRLGGAGGWVASLPLAVAAALVMSLRH